MRGDGAPLPPGGRPDAAAATPPVYELSEFLVDVLGVTDVGAYFPQTVAFHPTCHSQRMLGVGDRPQRLLAAVEGLRLVPLAQPTECCGFGGTFSVKNPDTSVAMGNDKVDDVLGTGADRAGQRRHVVPDAHRWPAVPRSGRHLAVRTMHLAEILAATR